MTNLSAPSATGPLPGEPPGSVPDLRIAVVGRPELYRHGTALALRQSGHGSIHCAELPSTAALDRMTGGWPSPTLALVLVPETGVPALSELAAACRRHGALPVVALAFTDRADELRRIAVCGVRGIIRFDLSPELAVAALRLIADGGMYLPPPLSEWRPWEETPDPQALATAISLRRGFSARETAVLSLLAQSFSGAEIAARLGISEGTVKVHLRNLRRATGARSRVALAMFASQWLAAQR